MEDSPRLVKNVFLTILGVAVASILYMVMFGFGDWEGALWYLARNVEVPISNYYYSYCFNPNIHSSDHVDVALGGFNGCTDLSDTEANLEDDDSDYISFGGTGFYHYSTGWR